MADVTAARLGEVAGHQGGLVATRQAEQVGVARKQLSRMAAAGAVERVSRLTLPRDLPTAPYRLYPIVDHVADKVCATMATNDPGGRRSSRAKDLVDLVVIARTQRIDLAQLRVATAAKRAVNGLDPFDTFAVPDDWGAAYRGLVAKTPAAADLGDLDAAAAFVAQLINPALAQPGDDAVWIPACGWVPPDDVAAPLGEDQGSGTSAGNLRAPSHTRAGWPVA